MRLFETCGRPGPAGSVLLVLRSGFSGVQCSPLELNSRTPGLFRCTTATSVESAVDILGLKEQLKRGDKAWKVGRTMDDRWYTHEYLPTSCVVLSLFAAVFF